MSDESKSVRCDCNHCGPGVWHDVVASTSHDDMTEGKAPDEWPVGFSYSFEMLKCCGCQDVCLRRRAWFSECDHDDPPEITYFPARISRRRPEWAENLPEGMRTMMDEVYVALQHGSARLAMMGARALVDMSMLSALGEDKGTFPQKLDAMVNDGHLGKKQREVLEAALEVGNAASHRGHRPKDEDVRSVIDIVEHVIRDSMLRDDVPRLKENTPQRKMKP